MLDRTIIDKDNLNALEGVIYWFASPHRIIFHFIARIAKTVLTPLIRLVLGIVVKRTLGLNTPCPGTDQTRLSMLRRYINSSLLSQRNLKRAFSILGTHYETVSVRIHPLDFCNVPITQLLALLVSLDGFSSNGRKDRKASILARLRNLLLRPRASGSRR